MRFEMIINTDGNVVTEVLDRQDSVCSNIKRVTNAIGREESDEHLPDGKCDRVEERQDTRD